MIYNILLLLGWLTLKSMLSYDVASGSDIMPCLKIDKQLVNYIFWCYDT